MDIFRFGSKIQFRKDLGLSLFLIISLPPLAWAQNKPTSAVGKWNAWLIKPQSFSGPQPKNRAEKVLFGLTLPPSQAQGGSNRANVLLEVDKEKIYVKEKNHVLLEIPTSEVAATGYDSSSHSKGWAWLAVAISPDLYNPEGEFTPFVVAPFLVGAAVAAPFKTTEHYVRIFWRGAEGPDEILMEVGKNDYAAVLAQLQRLTGKPWHDLPQEREKLRGEIELAKSTKKSLILDRTVFVNGAELKSGEYQLVLLERPANMGEIYFFRGTNVKDSEIAGQAVVEIDKRNHSTGAVVPAYGTEKGVPTISSLAMSEETIWLTLTPLSANVNEGTRRFYGGSGNWAIVTRMNYEGEPALRFTLFHLEYPDGCTGYLYVTHQRILFTRAPLSGLHCNTFTAARAEIQVKARGFDWTGRVLEVKWNEKTFNFRPVFDGPPQSAGSRASGDGVREFYDFFVRTVMDFDAVERETQPAEIPAAQPNN